MQTYRGKTVGKDGSMKVKTHQIQCTTVYDRKKQYLLLQSLPDLTPIPHSALYNAYCCNYTIFHSHT